jgi:hypothetical protein
MSIKKPQLFFYFFLILGIGAYQFLKPQPMLRKSFSGVNVSQFSSRGVVDRIINLQIDVTRENEITSSVSLPFDFDDSLQYKWILGQGVKLIEGSLLGSTEKGFTKGQPVKIKIKVSGFNSQNNHHIGFEVSGLKNNHRIYAEGLISSQFEKSFENTVQNVERLKAENSGAQK